MSQQRKRHLKRQPTEEAVRLTVSDYVGSAGTVDVQRMSYDWRADDLLIQIQLHQPIAGSTLLLFRRELASMLRSSIPANDPLQDWLVVIECAGETLERIAPYDKLEEVQDE